MELNVSETKNNMTNLDDFYFTIIIDLCNNMNHLNFDLKFVKKVLIETIAVDYLKNVFSLSFNKY